MNRRWCFFIPFAAQAQETGQLIATQGNVSVCMGKPVRRCDKPVNNECPTCGTMAAPFVIPKAEKCYVLDNSMPSSGLSGLDFPWCPPERTFVSRPYSQNITRCANCNAAFWQDAEVQP